MAIFSAQRSNNFPIWYRGTSLIRNSAPLGPYSGTMPRALWWPWGGGLFLMSEVPLYRYNSLGDYDQAGQYFLKTMFCHCQL